MLSKRLPLFAAMFFLVTPIVAPLAQTVRTLDFLLTSEFQDGQARGAITPSDMRDLIVSIGQVELDFLMYGVPANSAVLTKVFSRATIIAASAPIKCIAGTGATSSTTITLNATISGSTTSVGTLVFAASGSANQTCTVTFTTQKTFAAGDYLRLSFPGTADATLADIAISIPGRQQ